MINDRNRAAGVSRGNFLRCDQRDISSPKWYRFTGAAGYEMPTECVPKHRCGTHAPGWLSTPHPTRTGQIINGKVCFHWSGNCCRWSSIIQIKKCNGYYIYKLGKTPCCYLRYCGNGGFGKCLFSILLYRRKLIVMAVILLLLLFLPFGVMQSIRPPQYSSCWPSFAPTFHAAYLSRHQR